MKRYSWALLTMAIICTILVGCEDRDVEIGTANPVEIESTETTILPEAEPSLVGDWTLEECRNRAGIYIAHDDGSFTRIYGAGYLDKENGRAKGMFLHNSVVERAASVDKNDKLVVFCDSDYTLSMIPVNWEIGVIHNMLEDGTNAYTRVLNYNENDVDFFTYYDNHNVMQRDILYIDGIAAKDYPFEIVSGGERNTTGYGFPKDTIVTLGIKSGSSLIEESNEISATYFDCQLKRDAYGNSANLHYLYPTPTVDGYAVIDVYDGWHNTEIPSGKYVVELDMGNTYIACLLNWENS